MLHVGINVTVDEEGPATNAWFDDPVVKGWIDDPTAADFVLFFNGLFVTTISFLIRLVRTFPFGVICKARDRCRRSLFSWYLVMVNNIKN